MDELIQDSEGREVVKFRTPSGVTAWVATCIPPAALAVLERKLRRKLVAKGHMEPTRKRAQR